MQAVPLDVVDGHLVKAGNLLAGPGAAGQVSLVGPSPDVGIAHRGLDIDVDACGSGIGDGIDVALDILDHASVEDTDLEGRVLVEGKRRRASNQRA